VLWSARLAEQWQQSAQTISDASRDYWHTRFYLHSNQILESYQYKVSAAMKPYASNVPSLSGRKLPQFRVMAGQAITQLGK